MGRHSRGVVVITTRSWVMILSFAFTISILTAPSSSALSVDPVLDDVLSLAKRNQDADQRADSTASKNQNIRPSESAPSNPSRTQSQMPDVSPTASETLIITEPLAELPVIDTSRSLAQPIRAVQSSRVVPTSSAVLGVTNSKGSVPLQATSQGWKFFGIAWYWWVIVGVGGYYAVRRLLALHQRKSFSQKPMVS